MHIIGMLSTGMEASHLLIALTEYIMLCMSAVMASVCTMYFFNNFYHYMHSSECSLLVLALIRIINIKKVSHHTNFQHSIQQSNTEINKPTMSQQSLFSLYR